MSISQGRYVEVTANGATPDTQAETDLAAATQAGAIAGDIAGRAAGAEAGAQAGTEVAASAGAAAGAQAGEIAGTAAGTAIGATAGASAGAAAGGPAGAAAAAAVLAAKADTNGGNVSGSAAAWRTAIGAVGAAALVAASGATLVGITQSGAGAVTQTLQEWLRSVAINILGFGNDRAALDKALVEATDRGGAAVYIPGGGGSGAGGVYEFWHGNGSVPADNILGDGITIFGDGPSTQISGFPATGVIPNNAGNQNYAVFKGTGRRGVTIRDMAVRGYLSVAALYECEDVNFINIHDDGQLTQNVTNVLVITGITQASPGVLSYTGSDPADGDYLVLAGMTGMGQLEGTAVRARNIDTGAKTFELRTIDNVPINTTAFAAWVSGGTATLCTNWARDKGVYLNECKRVTLTNCRFQNAHFMIYTIGDQATVRCEQIITQGCSFAFTTAFGSYTAFFPVGVYFVDIEDGIVQGNTFTNIYSSIVKAVARTGEGIGYGVYQGDGDSRSIVIANNTFTFGDAGNRAAIPVYVGEATSLGLSSNTFNIAAGALVPNVVRMAANASDTLFNIVGNILDIKTTKDCYGFLLVGSAASTVAPVGQWTGNTVRGGTTAARVEFLGNGSYSFSGDVFTGQLGSGVYVIGDAAIPQKALMLDGVKILRSGLRAVDCAGYCATPVFRNCKLLDGNLSGATGNNAAAVLLSGSSYGIDAVGNTIGNTAFGGGGFVYGIANAVGATSRMLKDITANNTFVGLTNGAAFRRFNTTSPTTGIFDVVKGDVIENSDADAGEAIGWLCVFKNDQTPITDASSASTTVNVDTSLMQVGDPILLVKDSNPYDGGGYFTVTEFHQTTVASITNGGNFVMADAIPGGTGPFVAGTARILHARFLPLQILPGVTLVGNVDATLTAGTSNRTQVWNTALTANRVATLATTGVWTGAQFRVVRSAAATGAFTLTVAGEVLLPGQAVDVEYTGSAWAITGRSWLAADTGWTAATGTAAKGAYATYAGQTAGVAYVQAEAQATDDAVKALSQRFLALEQACRAKGIIV